MNEIFVNYRRSQAMAVAALVTRLRQHFGDRKVFLDLGMPSGADYPRMLRERIRACGVLLVVIHREWLADFGTPRSRDWVEEEIATALELGKPVIPVLFEDTPMPEPGQLPDTISRLAHRNAARIRSPHLTSDIDVLIRHIEDHVTPEVTTPGSRFTFTPARTARRMTASAVVFTVLPLISLYAPAWRPIALPPFGSTVLLVICALGSIMINEPIRLLDGYTQRRTSSLSRREFMARNWLLPAMSTVAAAILTWTFATMDGKWQPWETWYVVAALVTAAYLLHQWWRKLVRRDTSWPPPVSIEPVEFQRAAHRLHERLTTEENWRPPRSLAVQRQAVSIYLDLAHVRVVLERQEHASLKEWLAGGYARDVTILLGWLVSIVVLTTVAAVVRVVQEPVSLAFLPRFGAIVVVAVLATALRAGTARWGDRKDVAWKTAALTKWQKKLGPLIFCAGEQADERAG